MNVSKERKNGAILSYASIIVSTLIQLLYTPLLIRMLGKSEYGIYSLVASIMGYLTILDFGFGDAIVLYASKFRTKGEYEKEKQLYGMFQIIFFIIGIVALIIGCIIALNAHSIFGQSMTDQEIGKLKILLFILSFNIAITFAFSLYTSILKVYERYTFQKTIAILHSILRPIIMIPLLFLGFKSITLCLVITLLNIFVVTSNVIYCRKKLDVKKEYKTFDKALLKSIASYSFFIFLNIIVDKINWSTDHFVLGIVAGTTAITTYSIASRLNEMFIKLSTAVSSVLFPKMSKMVAQNASDEAISEEFIKVGRIQHYIVFLMTSGLVLFGKSFFIAWVGEEYIQSYYVALILILPLSIPLIQNLGISILKAKNIHKFRSVLYLIIALFNIIISIPLAKQFGAIGAAIGTAIPLIIGNIIIINIYYQKKAGLNIIKFWKQIIKITIPLAIPIIILIIFKRIVVLSGIKGLIVYGSIYTIIYVLVAYFISMNDYEKNIINKVLRKMHLTRRGK